MIAGRGLARIESGSKQGVTYLWLVGNGRMVVIVVKGILLWSRALWRISGCLGFR